MSVLSYCWVTITSILGQVSRMIRDWSRKNSDCGERPVQIRADINNNAMSLWLRMHKMFAL